MIDADFIYVYVYMYIYIYLYMYRCVYIYKNTHPYREECQEKTEDHIQQIKSCKHNRRKRKK